MFDYDPRHFLFKKIIVIFGLSVFAILTILFALLIFLPPKISFANPKNADLNASIETDIVIEFNRPINRDRLAVNITPNVEGEWRYEKSLLGSHLYKRIVFTPDTALNPEADYEISLTNVGSFTSAGRYKNFTISFVTQKIPSIEKASIENGAKDIAVSSPITLYLDGPNNELFNLAVAFEPQVDFNLNLSADKTSYEITFPTPLSQGVDYKLTAAKEIIVNKNTTPSEPYVLSFKTKSPPGVKSITPSGNQVLPDVGSIAITFDEPMVKEEVLKNISISPNIPGRFEWVDDKTLDFYIEGKLPYETSYQVKLAKNTHNQSGGFTENDITANFRTIGHVEVASTSPTNKATKVSTSSKISVTFNQAVDHASAEQSFGISPPTNGTFSWDGNKMTFSPEGLSRSNTYNFTIKSGIKSVYGLDSEKSYSNSFDTEEDAVTLNVPLDYQDKALSCELASLKMALNYRGIGVSENDILSIIGFDPTIRNGDTWGDPNSAFVGDINGRQNTTGYGVHWDPIAKAANHWRRATAFSGWTLTQMAQEIANGNPIVVWGVYGKSPYQDIWHTPNGKIIYGYKGEHARTLIGFKGSVANPTSFILNDPIAGKITWTPAQFSGNLATFGNSGVVIY